MIVLVYFLSGPIRRIENITSINYGGDYEPITIQCGGWHDRRDWTFNRSDVAKIEIVL